MVDRDRHAGAAAAGQDYSKDYWDSVLQELRKRRLSRFALGVLAVLYGGAVYAPLIANDRPYRFVGVDYREYNGARNSLVPAASSLGKLLGAGEDGPGAPRALAVERERQAVENRLEAMKRYLGPADRVPLGDLGKLVASACEADAAGDRSRAAALGARVVEQAAAIRERYAPQDASGGGGPELVPVVDYPLTRSLSGAEVFFMVLMACLLGFPLWNRAVNRLWLAGDPWRIRAHRSTKALALLGVSAAGGALWWALVNGSTSLVSSHYKARPGHGDSRARSMLFPPLRMGFAETHIDERFRPPTWAASAELTPEGHYKRGPRAPRPDPITGHVKPGIPVEVRVGEPPVNSPWRHLLGTDSVGRDMLVRMLYGGRISLSVGLVSTCLLVLIGVVVGAVAGYFGGWVDIAVSRAIEVFQSFPAFFLILTAVSLIPEHRLHPLFAIVFFIALVHWTGVARLVRGEFLRLKEQEFVIASRALGFGPVRVIFRHVLPNALGPVLVAAAFSVAAGILTESSISFLGFGIKHPIPSWGSLLNESRVMDHWWIQIFPGFLIFLTVFCYNVLGEALRDALDPRMRS